MKVLSPRAAALVAALRGPAPRRPRVFGRTDDRAVDDRPAILAALRDDVSPALVPELLSLVFGEPGAVRDAAVAVLGRALDAAAADDLLWLDHACRGAAFWPADHWRALTPAAVAAFDVTAPLAAPVLGVASFHPFGRVREAAAAALDRVFDPASGPVPNGRELPFLLIRRNDWGDAVAARAAAALERRVIPALAAAWLAWLPLLARLGTHTRRDAGDLAARVFALLRAPDQHPLLLARLADGDRGQRRACARLLGEAAPAPDTAAAFVAAALRDPDAVVRRAGVAGARRHLAAHALEGVLPGAFADRYPPVRRDALEAAAERLGERSTPWLVAGLLDRGRSAREFARFHLARRGVLTDSAGYYRERIAAAAGSGAPGAPARLAVAAAGLGETGTAADTAALVPLFAHARPAVRRAAARALGRLDAAGACGELLSLLHDSSPGVTRAAQSALRSGGTLPDVAALLTVLDGGAPTHGKLDALALADVLSKWDQLAVLLDAVGAGDARVRDDARRRLAGWLARQNASFAQPSATQLPALRTSLARHAAALTPTMAASLGVVLDYWAR